MGRVIFLDTDLDLPFVGSETDQFYQRKKMEYWFSYEGYTKVTLYDWRDRYEDTIKKESYSKIRRWMEDTLSGEVIIKYEAGERWGTHIIFAYFENYDDATIFKLTWAGDTNKE